MRTSWYEADLEIGITHSLRGRYEMNQVTVLQRAGASRNWRARLLRVLWGPVLLAALAAPASAASFGICIISNTFGIGGFSNAQYATSVVTAGCIPGFSSSIVPGAVTIPTTLPAGLTSASLELTQPMPFGGTAVATSTASLDQGILRAFSDTQGGVGGCGGTCTSTGGRSISEPLMADTLHFTITDAATSAIVTFNAHLGGTISLEGTSGDNYSISDQFILGGSGCWGSATGLGFQPCLSQNFGFLTSSFFNQSASGFDFTGTFQVTNGASLPFFAGLNADCSGGATCNFSNTASFSLSLPADVTFTSDSGVLFTQTPGGATTPEPGTFGVAAAALLGVGILRRRAKRQR